MENCTIYMHRKERGKGRERDLYFGQNLSEIATILAFITNLQFHEFFLRLSTQVDRNAKISLNPCWMLKNSNTIKIHNLNRMFIT